MNRHLMMEQKRHSLSVLYNCFSELCGLIYKIKLYEALYSKSTAWEWRTSHFERGNKNVEIRLSF